MSFISAKEISSKWGTSQKLVATWCTQKRIHHAKRIGNNWMIPEDAKKPADIDALLTQTTSNIRPFLKWAGGKGQLLQEIAAYYPFRDKQFTKYAEPFVGGGAVLFDVLNRFSLEAVYISDVNQDLINTYQVVRDHVDSLVKLLNRFQEEFLPKPNDKRKIYYIHMRSRFNALKMTKNDANHLERAALFLFLNKTCFNGLYRVNKRGAYNVPMGSYKHPLICDEENLRAVAQKLKNVQMICGSYQKSRDFIDAHTFAYFDPPYRPLSATANFTSYTAESFNDDAQIALAKFVDEMAAKDAKILVSNSDPKNANETDTFFDDLYAAYKIRRVAANRMINRNASSRGKISELLISNF